MRILVDTCVWSQAFRRQSQQNRHACELQNIIADQRTCIIGPIRQEILSGIRLKQHFQSLCDHLSAFPDLPINTTDYECAAEFSNPLRSNGVQGSAIEFLICEVAYRHSLLIYTLDNDFNHFGKHIPVKLYVPKLQ